MVIGGIGDDRFQHSPVYSSFTAKFNELVKCFSKSRATKCYNNKVNNVNSISRKHTHACLEKQGLGDGTLPLALLSKNDNIIVVISVARQTEMEFIHLGQYDKSK